MRVFQSSQRLADSRPASSGRPRRAAAVRRYVAVGAAALVGAYFLGRSLWADHQFAEAARAVERRDFADANARLARYSSVRPDDPGARLLAVRVARREHKYDVADARVRAVLEKDPRSSLLDGELRLLGMQRGNLPEIDAALTRARALGDAADPWELEAAIAGGMAVLLDAFARGDTAPGHPAYPFLQKVQGGAELWLRLRPAPPDQVEGLTWRGLTRALSNDRTGGPADLRAALEIDPGNRNARLNLALLLTQEEPARAAEHLQLLLRRDPDDAAVKSALAPIYRGAGRPAEAAALLDEVLDRQPDHLGALMERGAVAMDQGQPDRAERWLTRAQRLAPNDPRANFALAACLRAAGRGAEAEAFSDRYTRLVGERRKQLERVAPPAPGGPK